MWSGYHAVSAASFTWDASDTRCVRIKKAVRHADMNMVALIRRRGLCHGGLGHAKTLARCHAEMRKSGHAVVLLAGRFQSRKGVWWFFFAAVRGVVVTLAHVWAHVLP